MIPTASHLTTFRSPAPVGGVQLIYVAHVDIHASCPQRSPDAAQQVARALRMRQRLPQMRTPSQRAKLESDKPLRHGGCNTGGDRRPEVRGVDKDGELDGIGNEDEGDHTVHGDTVENDRDAQVS